MKRIYGFVFPQALLLAWAVGACAQGTDQNITVTVKPSQTVEQRVSDSIKERELREAADEKRAAEESARLAASRPRALLSGARTISVSSSTTYFKPVQLENALRKRSEFEAWDLAIIDAPGKHALADMNIEVDRPVFTFTFTYKVTDRSTGFLLTTGKVNAWDGNAAAPLLAKRIIEDIKNARADAPTKKRNRTVN